MIIDQCNQGSKYGKYLVCYLLANFLLKIIIVQRGDNQSQHDCTALYPRPDGPPDVPLPAPGDDSGDVLTEKRQCFCIPVSDGRQAASSFPCGRVSIGINHHCQLCAEYVTRNTPLSNSIPHDHVNILNPGHGHSPQHVHVSVLQNAPNQHI